jgi:hypothetical protein
MCKGRVHLLRRILFGVLVWGIGCIVGAVRQVRREEGRYMYLKLDDILEKNPRRDIHEKLVVVANETCGEQVG